MIRVLAFVEAHSVSGPAKNLLEFARPAGYPVQLEIAALLRATSGNDFTRAVERAGIPLHCVQERSAFDPRVLPRMREIISQSDPDVIETHALKSHFLVRLSGQWKRRPWIAFHHGYTSTSRRMLLYNQLDRWSLRRPDRVIVVCQAFERDLIRRGIPPGSISVLHNAVDPAWGEQARNTELRMRTRAALGIREEEQVILIVGRLSREKSHTLLVRALARLCKLLPETPIRLLIVGDGPERLSIERSAVACGVARQVTFTGSVDDVLPSYAAADLAVLASVTEGSPNALLEAMAARLPIVATAVGGIPEIVCAGETAILVPPGDLDSLAQALAQALTNKAESAVMAERAHSLILSRHTPAQRACRLLEIYQSTLRQSKPA